MIRHLEVLILVSTLVACSSAPAPHPAPTAPVPMGAKNYKAPSAIPLEDFFRNPAAAGFKISPDGKRLAVLKSWKSRMNVFVRSLDNSADEKQLTYQEDRDVSDIGWKGNDYILFAKDFAGDENFHLYSVNVASSDIMDLTPFPGVRAEPLDNLEDVSPTDVLVLMNRNNKELFDVYRVNVTSGSLKLVAQNKYKINNWLVDHDGNVRGGTASDGVNSVFYFEKNPGKGFAEIFTTNFRNTFHPVAMTADNRRVIMVSNLQRDLTALVEVDPLRPPGKFVVKTLYSHAKYDVNDGEYSLERKTLGRVGVITDRHETYFLNPSDQADWDYLKQELGGSLLMGSASRDENIWVVRTLSDRTRGEYFAFDRKKRQVTSLGNTSPWLQPELMSEMSTIHFRTRDGLEVEGYITIPHGREAHNLPAIVNPHGGPWGRDEWGFRPEVQFLASRGYAVLQMNFRGSTGYGRKFWEASFKQWGRKMQNDVSDALATMVGNGTIDPKRVCIYGGSYGGYSTLAGITFTPSLYSCAVDYVGVSNLFTFMKTIPPYWKPFLDMMYEMVGNPQTDNELLMETSPVFHADKIKAPLFIAQGANDPRVNKNESDQMVEALRKRGVEVEYMVKSNEGHGFHNEENRFDFYRTMEKFLAKHLGGHS